MGKICSRCKQEKDIGNFQRDKSSSTGYKYYCKQCAKKTSHESYKKNYKKINAKHNEWVKNHKEEWQEYYRDYVKENKDKLIAWKKKKDQENIERRIQRIKRNREENM